MGTGFFSRDSGAWALTAMLPSALPDEMPAIRDHVRELLAAASQQLFEMTGGQMYFGEIYLAVHPYGMSTADLRFDADMGKPPEDEVAAHADAGGIGNLWLSTHLPLRDDTLGDPSCCEGHPGWEDPNQQTRRQREVARLLHEFGHYAFGLEDEYRVDVRDDTQGHTCACIMGCKGIRVFCDTEHPDFGRDTASCWAAITKRHPALRRPSQSGFNENPGRCPEIEWHDIASESRIVIATHDHANADPIAHRTARAVSEAWEAIGAESNVRVFRPPAHSGSEPLFAISSGIAWLGEPRKLSSANLFFVGDPVASTTDSDVPSMVRQLVRGSGASASILSPKPIPATLRALAAESSGTAEVVTHEGRRAVVDMRTRVLARIACTVDGWGVSCKHRLLRARAAPPMSHAVHIEPRVRLVAFALVQPPLDKAAEQVRLEVRDPNGQVRTVRATGDGTIMFCTISTPVVGSWNLTVSGGAGHGTDATPVAILSMVDNPEVWIRATRPTVEGCVVKATGHIKDELRVQTVHRVARPPAEGNNRKPDARWMDSPSSSDSADYISALHHVAQTGYHDFRLDFDFPGNTSEPPVRRVLPYQVCVEHLQAPAKMPTAERENTAEA